MNTTDTPTILERSATVRFVRWLCTWPILRRILIGLAWIVTVIALTYGEENWRGRHAWNKYRRQLEAQGEQLDYQALIPRPLPDDQNFAATPLVQSWFIRPKQPESGERENDNYARAESRLVRPKVKDKRTDRQFLDLVAWEQALAAVRSGEKDGNDIPPSGRLDGASRAQAALAVLEGLQDNQAAFAELRAALRRPNARYPVDYDVPFSCAVVLPHLAKVKLFCERLQVKSCAELAAGQGEQALADIDCESALADSLKGEPDLISYLVRIACLQITAQPIWEGLAEHRWSDAQLQELERRLEQYNFVADLKRPLDLDRAAAIRSIEFVRRNGNLTEVGVIEPGSSQDTSHFLFRAIPSGWFYQEELSYCRIFQLALQGLSDPDHKQVFPSRAKANVQELERRLPNNTFLDRLGGAVLHHTVAARVLLPALGRVVARAATAQTTANQAAIACALERYRLAHGHYPERLDALAPRFMAQLPDDVVTGKAYNYRRTDDGRFVLYSIGWDEKDDGGLPCKTLFDLERGDWVWEYPKT